MTSSLREFAERYFIEGSYISGEHRVTSAEVGRVLVDANPPEHLLQRCRLGGAELSGDTAFDRLHSFIPNWLNRGLARVDMDDHPGTDRQHARWSRKLPRTIEELPTPHTSTLEAVVLARRRQT